MRRCEVEARGLNVYYGEEHVIDNVSFEVAPGEVLALVGPNGAGKTTMLKVLAGILSVGDGEVRACGMRASRGERLEAYRYLGYAPALPEADPWSRVEDLLASSRIGLGEVRPMATLKTARRLGVDGLWGRRFGELSSGERKLVMIAAALTREPSLILLDEPTSSLDLKNQALVTRVMREEAGRGVTIIIASHEFHMLHSYVDKALLLAKGRRAAYGRLELVLDKELLEGVYGVKLKERTVLVPV